jgi:hypothetical protein
MAPWLLRVRSKPRVVAELLVGGLGVASLAWAWRADATWFQIHMVRWYCFSYEADVASHRRWRWAAVVAGLVWLCVVRPLAGRWAARRTGRAALGTVVRFGLAIVSSLAVCEIALRIAWPFKPPPPVHFQLPPVSGDARLWWVNAPGTTSRFQQAGREIVYAYDAHGWRVRDANDVVDLARPTILFAGESVTAGLGVQYDETYPAVVGERLGLGVVNAAVHGYGHDQAYERMLDALALLQHPVAVVTMEFTQELDRDGNEARPTLRLDSHGLLRLVPPRTGWRAHCGLCELWRRMVPYHDDSGIATARAVLADTMRQARDRGAYPLFVEPLYMAPCMPDADGTVPAEQRMFDGLGADLERVPIDPTFMVRLSDDRNEDHPDARAHRQIADVVVAALRRAHIPVSN